VATDTGPGDQPKKIKGKMRCYWSEIMWVMLCSTLWFMQKVL
jgi:hypothetical protein